MIKYILCKYEPDGFGGETLVKRVDSYNKKKYLDKGFIIVEKRYFLITSFIHWWSNLKIEVRISIITLFFTAFYFFLSLYLDNQYKDLKYKYESLENKHIQLNNTLIITSDSLKVERDLSRLLRKQIVISKNLKKTIIQH